MTRRKLMFLAAGAVVLGMVALIMARYMQVVQQASQRADDRNRVIGIIVELRGYAQGSQPLDGLTPHMLLGAMEGARISPRGDYSLTIAGSGPAWQGTRAVFTSGGSDVVVLTVKDLAAGDWDMEEEPLPSFLEFWK